VIDVVKRDEEGACGGLPGAAGGGDASELAVLRGLYCGAWRGLYDQGAAEVDLAAECGAELQSWADVSAVGMVAPALADDESGATRRVALVGAATAAAAAPFLARHFPRLELTVVEPRAVLVEALREHFGLPARAVVLGAQGETLATALGALRSLDAAIVDHRLGGAACAEQVLALCSGRLVVTHAPADESLLAQLAAGLRRAGGPACAVTALAEHLLRDDSGGGGGGGGDMNNCDDDFNNEANNIKDASYEARQAASFVVLARTNPSDASEALSAKGWAARLGRCAAAESGAMDVATAQRTKVVRLPGFLGPAEIAEVHAAAAEAAGGAGVEVRSDPSPDPRHVPEWVVSHLHSGGWFAQRLPWLLARAHEAARRADEEQGWGLLVPGVAVNLRVAEYHSMALKGRLGDPHHYDLDSLITVDIMLAAPREDFEGGQLQTLELDGAGLKPALFELGDASVFVAHKKHCVSPVTRGRRHVLVLEFWGGPARTCPHRCELLRGACPREASAHASPAQAPLGGCPVAPKAAAAAAEAAATTTTTTTTTTTPATTEPPVLPFRLGSVNTLAPTEHYQRCELLWQPAITDATKAQVRPGVSEADKQAIDRALALFA
jgi:hypothetical protein